MTTPPCSSSKATGCVELTIVDLYLPRSIPRPYSLPRRSQSHSHTWRWSGCPCSSACRPLCPSGSPRRGSGGWGRCPDGNNTHFIIRTGVETGIILWIWVTVQCYKLLKMFMSSICSNAVKTQSQMNTLRWVWDGGDVRSEQRRLYGEGYHLEANHLLCCSGSIAV